jgi:hypothetical protein
MTTTNPVTVSMLVHHGNYREEFLGIGSTIEEAARNVSAKSSYSDGLYDLTSGYYDVRQKHRDELVQKLSAGEQYIGFGWMTYKLVP